MGKKVFLRGKCLVTHLIRVLRIGIIKITNRIRIRNNNRIRKRKVWIRNTNNNLLYVYMKSCCCLPCYHHTQPCFWVQVGFLRFFRILIFNNFFLSLFYQNKQEFSLYLKMALICWGSYLISVHEKGY